MPYRIPADPRVCLGMARTRANDQLRRVLLDELIESNLIIPEYSYGSSLENEVLVNIPGKGVVVVYEDNIGCGRDWRGRIGMVG